MCLTKWEDLLKGYVWEVQQSWNITFTLFEKAKEMCLTKQEDLLKG